MIVRHIHNNHYVERQVDQPVAVFLRSSGAWFSQFTSRQSRYEGWFLGNEQDVPHQYYKILERISIAPHENAPPTKIVTRTTGSRLEWDAANLTIVPVDKSGLVAASDKPVPMVLSLDMRHIYAYPGYGRSYKIEDDESGILISYTDSTLDQTLYLHIRGNYKAINIQEATWNQQRYPRDTVRHSAPDTLFTYTLPPLLTSRLHLGCGLTIEEAKAGSSAAESAVIPQFSADHPGDPVEIAKHTVQRSLQFLTTPDGIYAGFPWFHQFWSRDELITALGIPEDQQLELIKKYLELPLHEGELPTYRGSGTICADGVGWLALLIKEYGIAHFSPDLREKMKVFFGEAREQLNIHRRTPSGLIYSGHNATWMDTIGRTGFRIEIQCMYGLVLDILHQLTGSNQYRQEHLETLTTTRHFFFHNGTLLDGLYDDMTQDTNHRPNGFIAYLIQPALLSSQEWAECFKSDIAALKTSWGGLTSLASGSDGYQDHSTGENNHSYHQGDSWFFVNNLAALALKRHGHQSFAPIQQKLLSSSTEEILWQHFLGMPGEIASAADGASWGCGIQGFSGGAYLKAL